MNVVIMCQGEQRRLRTVANMPKHLLLVNGEPILERTLRLLGTHLAQCDYTAHVVGPPVLQDFVMPRGQVEFHQLADPGMCIVAGIEASRPIWRGDRPALILMGDVVWSEAALCQVIAEPPDNALCFWGTPHLSPSVGEVFAMRVTQPAGCPQDVDNLLESCACRSYGFARQQGGHLRRLYWHAEQRQRHRPAPFWGANPQRLYRHVIDWTTDIDTPQDMQRLPELSRLAELEERALHPVSALF